LTAGDDEPRRSINTRFLTRFRVAVAVVCTLGLVLLQRVLSEWLDRTGAFITGLAVLLIALLLLDWASELLLPRLWRRIKRGAAALRDRFVASRPMRWLGSRFPRLSVWIRARFSTRTWTGWYLTVTIAVSAYFLWEFAEIVSGIITGAALARLDPGLSGLLRAIRTPGLTRVMWSFTLLGDTLVAFALTALVAGLLVLWGKRRYAVLMVATVAFGTALESLLKLVVARSRPPVEFMLIKSPVSYSFPSGHATEGVLFIGVATFVILREMPSIRGRLATLLAAVVTVGLIGVSRVYLGVHWATDVIAGWDLGMACLSASIGTFLMWERYGHPFEDAPAPLDRPKRAAITAGVVVVAVVVVTWGGQRDPVLVRAVAPPPTYQIAFVAGAGGLPTLPEPSVLALPRFAEKLNGSHQAPVGLIFIGTRSELTAAFSRAGWQVADQATVLTVLRAVIAAIANQPDPTAPVTPSFLDGKTQDIAFEKEAGVPSIRRRHHTRFWVTEATVNGVPVWVASASLDVGVGLGKDIPLPSHVIDPNIDAERDYIVSDLRGTGLVRQSGVVRVSPPTSGTNAQGDPFHTSGLAVVLVGR
jgi:membrane-associated phospholipid phosphatase